MRIELMLSQQWKALKVSTVNKIRCKLIHKQIKKCTIVEHCAP